MSYVSVSEPITGKEEGITLRAIRPTAGAENGIPFWEARELHRRNNLLEIKLCLCDKEGREE